MTVDLPQPGGTIGVYQIMCVFKVADVDLLATNKILSKTKRIKYPGLGFIVVADFSNLILRHVQTSKTCCRLVLIYNIFVDLQQNC